MNRALPHSIMHTPRPPTTAVMNAASFTSMHSAVLSTISSPLTSKPQASSPQQSLRHRLPHLGVIMHPQQDLLKRVELNLFSEGSNVYKEHGPIGFNPPTP